MAGKKLYHTAEELQEAHRRNRKRHYDANPQRHMAECQRYEKTPKGYLMRTYRNMLSRVTGVQRKKAHLYLGLSILPREDFYAWALEDPDFQALFRDYEASGYQMKFAPSINRIDSSEGYELWNMEWLTHSENSRLGSLSRYTALSTA